MNFINSKVYICELQETENKGSFLTEINLFLYVIIVLIFIFIIYQGIGSVFTLVAGGFKEPDVKTMRVILAFSQFMLILAPAVFFTRLRSNDLKTDLRLKAPGPFVLLLSVLGIISVQPLLQGYLTLQESFIDSVPFLKETLKPLKEIFDTLEESTLKIVRAYSFSEFLTVVFVISVTPAVCEEVLFRGFVLGNFLKLMKPFLSVFLSGFLFALYHFQPFNLLPLVALGFYLGYVVYFSGSIWTGVICHFVNNFMASYFLYSSGKEEFETPDITGDKTLSILLVSAVSVVFFIYVLVSIYRYGKEGKTE
ncbi:MAG: CPBP family intramembrane metalloprotease [Ignavibacteria bacterium]|nr:CPBP family intramembrane metalloprotease [Ignavibacteria bacterium]